MEEFGRQIALVLGILAWCFAGPGVAIFFLLRRKRRARARRRAPIERSLLRSAGESLREQIDELNTDVLWDIALLQTMPLVVLTTFLAQRLVFGIANTTVVGAIYAGFSIAFVIYGTRKLLRAGECLDHLKAGFDAEVAAGQELDRLMRQDAHVFHDVPGESFNIDHVVVSTVGIFAVETKGFTKLQDGNARK